MKTISFSNGGKISEGILSHKGGKIQNYAFMRDVIKPVERLIHQKNENEPLQSFMEMLMGSASPLEQFNRLLISRGESPIETYNGGDHEEGKNRDIISEGKGDSYERYLEDAYSYNMDDAYVRDFSSYSFKYGKCQPIQRFSQDAVENGEYSALVTDYMIVFRFCPSRSCSSSRKWGCNSGYGEYVIKLSNYLKAMMYYQVANRDNLCPFCQECDFTDDYFYGGRRLEDYGDDAADDVGADDDADDGADDYNYYGGNGDDVADDVTDEYVEKTYSEECLENAHLCEGHTSWCFYGNDDDAYKDTLDYLDYMDYFDCVNIDGQNGQNAGYWVSPRCNSNGKIEMGIFYDPFCSQFAGNDINLRDTTGIKFVQDIFAFTYHGHCLSCDQNAGAPLYGTTHNLCNKVYSDAGKCNQYLAYSVDDDDSQYSDSSSSDISCAYIENIRHGVYDEYGDIYVGTSSQSSALKTEVTSDQKIFLVLMILICVVLSLYSCFIHHEITNLLLHKLSYQGSLAPNTRISRSNSNSRRRTEDSRIDDYYSYTSDSFSYA